jgi:hypothetical protein
MADQHVEEFSWDTQNKTIHVWRTDPYGFLTFRFKEGGALPEELSGNHTSFESIKAAAASYMKGVTRTHNADKERPVLQRKAKASRSGKVNKVETVFSEEEALSA